MNRSRSHLVERARHLLLKMGAAIILWAGIATMATAETPPIVGSANASQHNFLTFQSYPAVKESPLTSDAYYRAIDPGYKKRDFRDWLVNAGFIANAAEWTSTGQQVYTTVPGDYGPNKVNAFAHIIILNAGDLGFIRNQYIRCNPDCKTPGARIYTYLENYAVPDAAKGDIALTKQSINNVLANRVGRIADVAFEWAPSASGTSPSTLFGQLYSFVVHTYNGACGGAVVPDSTVLGGYKIDELYTWPADQAFLDCTFNNRASPLPAAASPDFLKPRPDYPVVAGQMFAPELDQLGTKMHPGACFICHGGYPSRTVQNTLIWEKQGNVQDFRMLPADVENAIFGVDGSPLAQSAQETDVKKYNQVIAITQGAKPPKNAFFAPDGTIAGGNWTVSTKSDGNGTPARPSHGLEVIFGWYAADPTNPNDFAMASPTQFSKFVPVGWRSATSLYLRVVQPSCRSCHMNREQSLDFGTLAQFDSNKGNIQDMVFQPQCDALLKEVKPDRRVMPLAKLTWDRFWNGIDPVTKLTNDAAHTSPAGDPNSQPNLLKAHFGYSPTSFCAKPH